MVLCCFLTDDFRWKFTETLEKHDQSEVIFVLSSLPLTRSLIKPVSAQLLSSVAGLEPKIPDPDRKLAGAAPFHRYGNICWISTNRLYGLANQKQILCTCMITCNDFFFFLHALRFSPTVCHHLTQLMEKEAGRTVRCVFWSWASPKARPPALMSCEISFQAGLQIVSQVCRACRNIHLLHSHIFFFLTSCLLRQKEPDKFSLSTKGSFGPFLTLEWYLLSWLTPAGLLNQDQGLALKTRDSGADGSCSNTEESLQMRMFQPQKLLPCCKFYKPTLKRERRLL